MTAGSGRAGSGDVRYRDGEETFGEVEMFAGVGLTVPDEDWFKLGEPIAVENELGEGRRVSVVVCGFGGTSKARL